MSSKKCVCDITKKTQKAQRLKEYKRRHEYLKSN